MKSVNLNLLFKSAALFALLVLCSSIGYAQEELRVSGTVVDVSTREPLAYVNIGLKTRAKGAVSGAKGEFKLLLSSTDKNDTLYFSSVGYAEKGIAIADLVRQPGIQIELDEAVTVLDDFVVRSKNRKGKYKKYGIQRSGSTAIYIGHFDQGAQMAHLIKAQNYPLTIAKARFHMNENTVDSLTIRVRVLEVDKRSGLPGRDLLQESVTRNIGGRTGWIEVDIEDFGIEVKEDFFLSIEFLNGQHEASKSYLVSLAKGDREGRNQYLRAVSYGNWKPNFATFAIGAELVKYK